VISSGGHAARNPKHSVKNLTLRWQHPDDPVSVLADRETADFRSSPNLVTNALNYHAVGRARSRSLSSRRTAAALIVVEDTGIGIASEILPFIFQPFYRVVSRSGRHRAGG